MAIMIRSNSKLSQILSNSLPSAIVLSNSTSAFDPKQMGWMAPAPGI